jgi:hypothetical protein
MSEPRTVNSVYDEKGRITQLFVEGIVIPREPGHVDLPNKISEQFMVASKMDEARGGFKLMVKYYDHGAHPARPYAKWVIQDTDGVTDSISSISHLASHQAFMEYNHVYWLCGYFYKDFVGLKVYELHDQMWVEVASHHEIANVTHVGANNQPVSSGGEVKQFFSPRGNWTSKLDDNLPLLYRCSPASYRVTNLKDTQAIKNEMADGAEDVGLSDPKLSSADSPFNESALNMGYGAFELQYDVDAAGNTLLFAPYLKRHSAQEFEVVEEMSLGTLLGTAVNFDGWPTDNGTSHELGDGGFSRTTTAVVVDANHSTDRPVPEQKPGLNLDGQKQVTVIGFYKPEIDVPNDQTLDVNGHPLSANPCGVYPASINLAYYLDPLISAHYTPYGPQYYSLNAQSPPGGVAHNTEMHPSNIGIDFQDYPSFFGAAGVPTYNLKQATAQWARYRKPEAFYRTLYNSSSNTGMIGGTNAEAVANYPVAANDALFGNFALGSSWIGRYDLNIWFLMWNLGQNNEITFLNDALRIGQDQALWAARRFLVRGSANGSYQQVGFNAFSAACWPFDRIRFGKMFRCCHDSSQFTPWLGQRNNAVLNNGANSTPGWVNVSRNSPEGGLEGFPFLQFFRRPPVAGLMTCLVTDMQPPAQVDLDTSVDEFPAPSLKAPGGPVSSFVFRKTAMAPSMCVVLRTRFDGSGVIDEGWLQLQGLHSVDPTPVGVGEEQTEMPEIDNVYQVMQITGLPLQKIIPNQDTHFNVWHMYVASIDTEHQRAFIGCAPVPQYEHGGLVNYTNLAGWATQQATYVLGHDASIVNMGSPQPAEQAGPDRNIIARVSRFGTEYDFSYCQPLNHPHVGENRRRLLIASKDSVDYGLCIHAPTGPEETEELKANTNTAAPQIDPHYNYTTNDPEQLDTTENRFPDPAANLGVARFNMLGNVYTLSTYNTMGCDRNGYDSQVFKGKIGEHLIIPGVYINGDGKELSGANVPQYSDYPSGPFNDLGIQASETATSIGDALAEVSGGVKPPYNFSEIAPNQKSSVCIVDAIRIHKQPLVDVNGTLLPDVCPATFRVMGPQPHYDLDTDHVTLDEKVTFITFDEEGNTVGQVEP